MIFLPIEKNMRRRRKRKRQKGGIIQPSSIIPFLGSSTMMPGAYLNMWEKKKKKKKQKTQKGRGLSLGKFFGQKLINKKKTT